MKEVDLNKIKIIKCRRLIEDGTFKPYVHVKYTYNDVLREISLPNEDKFVDWHAYVPTFKFKTDAIKNEIADRLLSEDIQETGTPIEKALNKAIMGLKDIAGFDGCFVCTASTAASEYLADIEKILGKEI